MDSSRKVCRWSGIEDHLVMLGVLEVAYELVERGDLLRARGGQKLGAEHGREPLHHPLQPGLENPHGLLGVDVQPAQVALDAYLGDVGGLISWP
jgi:hypothetical protein